MTYPRTAPGSSYAYGTLVAADVYMEKRTETTETLAEYVERRRAELADTEEQA